jgi:PTH1 family peptidyl-tRNA hydrolase
MRYTHTRHNVGFTVARRLAHEHGIRLASRRFKALYGCGNISAVAVAIVLPMTYMNRSGDAVDALLRHFQVSPERMLVIADDMALPVGMIRIRLRGSSGGQKGLESIIQRTRTEQFARLRVGIGQSGPGQAVDHVLSGFTRDERPLVKQATDLSVEAVCTFLTEGPESAMNRFNRKAE